MTKERLYEQSFADAALFLRCGNAGGMHRQMVKEAAGSSGQCSVCFGIKIRKIGK